MSKKVLLAIDLHSPGTWAASYAIQLAARLQASLILMAILPEPPAGANPGAPEVLMEDLKEEQRLWLGQVREESQREGVPLEIFVSAGAFSREVLRFVSSQSGIRFIVLGLPGGFPPKERQAEAVVLRTLKRIFTGEILLVPGQGQIQRLTEHNRQN
jgi:nucleotide-binding universal stress UspA family protein